MPPIRYSASLAAGISSSQARMTGASADARRSLAVIRRSSTKLRASLIFERLGQQLVQIQHLDAALLHLQHEIVVVLLGLVDPDHVVEQQVVALPGVRR